MFLTDQWEWGGSTAAGSLDEVKALAKEALIALVRDERPELACITVLDQGVRVGVWDWVADQPYWSVL